MILSKIQHISVFTFLFFCSIVAAEILPLPRFASIKSDKVNVRTGPGPSYPIEWVFVSKGEPVEIFAEYDSWRRIRDIHGEGGWIHSSMLSGKRYLIMKSKKHLYSSPGKKGDAKPGVVALIEPNVRCELLQLAEKYCKVKCNIYEGWLQRADIFGVYENEK